MRWLLCVSLCGLLGCGDDSAPGDDSGRGDAGGVDAPGVDTGPRRDSGGGTDSGGGGDDAGGGGDLDCRNFASWPSDWAAEEEVALAEMNRHRQAGTSCPSGPKASVPPLEMSRELRIAARCHSMDMATNDFFSHTGTGDTSFGERARSAGYEGRPRNENIAAGNGTGIASVGQWMGSDDGHCDAIMNDASNEVGIGYMPFTPSMWRHYWTGVFGSR